MMQQELMIAAKKSAQKDAVNSGKKPS